MDAVLQIVGVVVQMARQALLAVEMQARQPLAALGMAPRYQTAILILLNVGLLIVAMRWLRRAVRVLVVAVLVLLLIQLTSPYAWGGG